MKIAFVSHDFPPYGFGGVGTYTYDLANELAKNGHKVTVYCPKQKRKKEIKARFKIVRLPMIDLFPHAIWFQLQNRKFFAKELKKYDVINFQYNNASFMPGDLLSKSFVTFHSTPRQEMKKFLSMPKSQWSLAEFVFNVLEYPMYRYVTNKELRNCKLALSVGKALTKNIREDYNYKGRIVTIQNGIQPELILKNLKNTEPKKPRLLFFGRLYYRKGITYLMEAVKKVKQDFVLDIYGEGPLQKTLERIIVKEGLQNIVKLKGFCKREQIFEEISKSTVVVLPSLYEAFSIAYLEAMACAKPLIVFDYSFSKELISHEDTGLLVKRRSSAKLARAIDELLKDKRLRAKISIKAQKHVLENFTLSQVAEKYEKVYQEA